MRRTPTWAVCLLATLLAATFVNQGNGQSTVETGGDASASGSTVGGSTTTSTSSMTTTTTSSGTGTTTTTGGDLPPPPAPPPPPVAAAAVAAEEAGTEEPAPVAPPADVSTSVATAAASASGTGTVTTSVSQTTDGVTTSVSQTTGPSAGDSDDSGMEEESAASDVDDVEMPSADEGITSRSAGNDEDLILGDEDATDEESKKVDPSTLPVCVGIPKFSCCDDKDFVTSGDKTFCRCWGFDVEEGCEYAVDQSSNPIVVEDLNSVFGGSKCRCKDPEEVIYDECFGRTKSDCCDNLEEGATKCRCLFGTDRCIYEKGDNGVWKNTLFSSGDCVCPGK